MARTRRSFIAWRASRPECSVDLRLLLVGNVIWNIIASRRNNLTALSLSELKLVLLFLELLFNSANVLVVILGLLAHTHSVERTRVLNLVLVDLVHVHLIILLG